MQLFNVKIYFFLFVVFVVSSQEREQIEIKFAPYMTIEEKNPEATILTRDNSKQVHIKHKGIELWCDKAVYYQNQDFIEAFGKVLVKQGDSLDMTSNYAEYSGITQLAYASGDVVLIDSNSKLYTDILYFDRVKQQALYNQNGKVEKDSSGTITSKIGRYFVNEKKYQFSQNVELINPEYVINTRRLDFYTDSGYSFLYGESKIVSNTSTIYCERGFYDTKSDTGYFVKKSKIDYDERTIIGDSIYFNRNTSFASANNNIKVIDTLNKTLIKGHYAEVFRLKDSVFITKRAIAIKEYQNDSIYIHADKLMVTGPPNERILRGYYNAKIYKSDLSGKADSIHMNQRSGKTQLINFYKDENVFSKKKFPILWHNKNQITGDSIHLISNSQNETLDSLKVFNNAFIISMDTIDAGYNQIKGKKLDGIFLNNELKILNIIKNAESIYYLRDSKNELVGIDKSKSASIKIFIDQNRIEEIRKINQIDGKTYPKRDFPKNEDLLKGFVWREEERPLNVEDLFSEDPPLKLPVIEGLKEIPANTEFFDNNLNERIEKAKKISIKNNNDNKNIDNKAARQIPEKN
tara:strand:- start:49911 stop:51641 length:1731 start_codon:yes stop_codon:yes gene_type:complete